MKFKFSIPVLVATFALSSAAMFPTQAQAQTSSQRTIFLCVNSGGRWVTVAQRGTKPPSAPMITWKTAVGEYSQQDRCEAVSSRLTNAVAQNGGSLHGLLLTSGRVNGQTVICFVNKSEHCNSGNILFTLVNPKNASNSGDVLAKLLRFGQYGTGSSINEAGGGTDGGEAPVVSLQEAVDNAFAAGSVNESGSGEQSTPRQNPSNQPDPGSNTDGNNGGGAL